MRMYYAHAKMFVSQMSVCHCLTNIIVCSRDLTDFFGSKNEANNVLRSYLVTSNTNPYAGCVWAWVLGVFPANREARCTWDTLHFVGKSNRLIVEKMERCWRIVRRNAGGGVEGLDGEGEVVSTIFKNLWIIHDYTKHVYYCINLS